MKKTFVKFFKHLADRFFVFKKIDGDEIISRVLTCPKHVSEDGQIPDRKFKDFFIPLNGGVSVNRYRYLKEDDSKRLGKTFKEYRGFAIFNIKIFFQSLSQYQEKYPNDPFNPTIKATPLNLKLAEIQGQILFKNRKGNLAHADIIFPEYEVENPNISIRNFSRFLAINSVKLLDSNKDGDYWEDKPFYSAIED